jgi:hypothetical protein
MGTHHYSSASDHGKNESQQMSRNSDGHLDYRLDVLITVKTREMRENSYFPHPPGRTHEYHQDFHDAKSSQLENLEGAGNKSFHAFSRVFPIISTTGTSQDVRRCSSIC